MGQHRILIVEDHEDSRASLHRLLVAHGYEVRSTGSVAEAERELGWEPHAIVLDLMLPDHDGLELLRQLPTGTRPPKVGILSAGSPSAKNIPPSVPFFLKPLDYRRLLEWLAQVLDE